MVFFFNDTATTEIYTLSLHDALPIFSMEIRAPEDSANHSTGSPRSSARSSAATTRAHSGSATRSEEHTSELQSRQYLVCRLLLEKTKRKSPSTVFTTYSSYLSRSTST